MEMGKIQLPIVKTRRFWDHQENRVAYLRGIGAVNGSLVITSYALGSYLSNQQTESDTSEPGSRFAAIDWSKEGNRDDEL